MKKFFTLFMLISAIAIGFNACEPDNKETDETTALPDKMDARYVFSGDNVLFTLPDLLQASSNSPEMTIPETSAGMMDSIAGFLLNNPGYSLNITGLYTAEEDSIEGFDNLGLARAEQLAAVFIAKGVEAERINMKGQASVMEFDENGILDGGYLLSLEEAKEVVIKKNEFDRTIYFFAADDNLRYDDGLKEYIPKVTQYLSNNPGLKMILTGHTDYNGNKLLGEMRAEQVIEYFVLYGAPESRMVIRSEGPDNPVAPNDTQENKSKNRRVEITFE